MTCLREVQTISKSPHILPMPSLTRLTTGGVLNPLKNTTNTSHNELLHQDPLQPPLEPRGNTRWPTRGSIAQEDSEAFLRTDMQEGERSARQCTTTADARCCPAPGPCHRTRITIADIVADCAGHSCWLRCAVGTERSPVAHPSHRSDAPIPLRDNTHSRKMHTCPQAPPT